MDLGPSTLYGLNMSRTLGGSFVGLACGAAAGLWLVSHPGPDWLGDASVTVATPLAQVIAFLLAWPFHHEAAMMAVMISIPITLSLGAALVGALVAVGLDPGRASTAES